jgi:hypothetical protein
MSGAILPVQLCAVMARKEFIAEKAMKAQRRSRGIALLFL